MAGWIERVLDALAPERAVRRQAREVAHAAADIGQLTVRLIEQNARQRCALHYAQVVLRAVQFGDRWGPWPQEINDAVARAIELVDAELGSTREDAVPRG